MATIPQYQSITISAGQTGYIPKTATLIGITSVGDASPYSGCLDLSNIPDTQCYAVISAQAISDSTLRVFSNDGSSNNNLIYNGISVNGVSYMFGAPVDYFDGTSLVNAIRAIPSIGNLIILSSTSFGFIIDPASFPIYNLLSWLVFSTIPQIGNTFQLLAATRVGPPGSPYENFTIPAKLRSLAVVDFAMISGCPSPSSSL